MFRLDALPRLALFAGLIVLASACAPMSTPAATASTKIKVVATTTQVTALAQVVGGDQIALTGIMKAGIDPHAYEPTPLDVRAVADAQLILENGVGLESWLNKVIQNSGTHAPVIDTSKGVQIRHGDAQEPLGDPHIWHSIPNAIIMLNNIRDSLAQIDPAHAAAYQANAAMYQQTLNELDQYIMAQVASIPAPNRKLVTNHDTLGYYADRYGLTFVGSIIPSMDTSYQPSAK